MEEEKEEQQQPAQESGLEELSDHRRGPLTDDFAAIAPRISAIISLVASALIICFILRSKSKLSTTYHRIMFGMSCADILGSIAIGLTTLPMPKEFPDGMAGSRCDWSGTRLGTIQTCEAQGFFFVFGVMCMFYYNAALIIYYVCTITLRMEEANIKKKVEPFLHLIPWTIGLVSAGLIPLFSKYLNATAWGAWCTLSDGGGRIPRGTGLNVEMSIAAVIGILLITYLVCFPLIIWRVQQTERALNGPNIKRASQTATIMRRIIHSHHNTKVVTIQALGYTTTFLLTIGLPLIRVLREEADWVWRPTIIISPLQGFFNAFIFVGHKVYNYRRVHDEDVSICKVIYLIFKGNIEEQEVLFSRISLIRLDQDRRVMDLELQDENGIVERLCIDVDGKEIPSGNIVPWSLQEQSNNEDVFVEDDGNESGRYDLSGFSTELDEKQINSRTEEIDYGCQGSSIGGSSNLSVFVTPTDHPMISSSSTNSYSLSNHRDLSVDQSVEEVDKKKCDL